MSSSILIYGATGYTGRLILEEAIRLQLPIVIGGRDAASVIALARECNLESRVFATADAARFLTGCAVLLNCAGPFASTAPDLISACLQTGVDYLDITAELGTYQIAESLAERARESGVMLLPGVGWDVVPSDCLALHVARQTSHAKRIRLALKHYGGFSRGSVRSAQTAFAQGALKRTTEGLRAMLDSSARSFDFGAGLERCVPVPLGDIVTAWHSTGIADIEEFFAMDETSAPPAGDFESMPAGPSEEERASGRSFVVAQVETTHGDVITAGIETLSGYSFTQKSAPLIAQRVLSGIRKPGFATPASLLGADFVLSVPGSRFFQPKL